MTVRHVGGLVLTVVGLFDLGCCDVGVVCCDLDVESAVVEPIDVAEYCELDVIEVAPWPLRINQLPLVEAVECLGHSVDAPMDGPARCRLSGAS